MKKSSVTKLILVVSDDGKATVKGKCYCTSYAFSTVFLAEEARTNKHILPICLDCGESIRSYNFEIAWRYTINLSRKRRK